MKKLLVVICLVLGLCCNAKSDFVIVDNDSQATIAVSNDDWPGVKRAANDLGADIERVAGKRPVIVSDTLNSTNRRHVIIGTIGHSPLIDNMVSSGKLDVGEVDGQWESYLIEEVDGNLVIAGSDKRGTIYGIYDISERIGVSPWYWWADVPVPRRDVVTVSGDRQIQPSPKVKYRGIFINDEWPSFGGWALKHFGDEAKGVTGINSKMYSHMFELLLRLKANYLWPAMWDSRFNEDDPLTQALADEYGIVMGTSHHEPMMRAHKEYVLRKDQIGAWDYIGNRDRIEQFFTEGIQRAKDYDNIITIGMRGDGDVALGESDEECINSLRTIIAGQRDIIERVYGKPASEVPQMWAIFTEVQRYYDAGLTVPDDVTLLFCDNNWGYVRRTGPENERGRKGGMGLYYHIDMNGGPWNDRWVNTTTVAKMREQLWLAYQTGLDRIWIINVGDLKPKEMPIDFIMRYAWEPEAVGPNDCERWMETWAEGIFGNEHAREIAQIVTEYSKLNLERKPEVQHVGIYNIDEARSMMRRWDALEQRTMSLSKKIAPEYRDAFYQLVEYPAVASAGVAKIYLAATLGDTITMQTLFERDRKMTERYNKEIASGKWDGMMQDKHIGYEHWFMPDSNSLQPIYAQMAASTSTAMPAVTTERSIMAHDYTNKTSAPDGTEWLYLPGLGRGDGNMGVWPVTAQSRPDGDGATLEYAYTGAPAKLALGILPTNDVNPSRGLRIGVVVDNGAMQTVDCRQGYVDTFNEYTPQNLSRSQVLKPLPKPATDIYLSGYRQPMRNEIFDNLRWLSIDPGDNPEGNHTIKIVMIDPEVVVEKLVINPDNSHPSYYGSPGT